jgi:hypothetical protein
MALGKLLGPLCVGREAGLVDVRGDIASDAGISIFEPGAALVV